MKKILSILLVAMFTMVTMSSMIIDPPPVVVFVGNFVVRNQSSGETITVDNRNFSSKGEYTVNFSEGIYEEDELEITYNPPASLVPLQAVWFRGWRSADEYLCSGFRTDFRVLYPILPSDNTLAVACKEYVEGKNENPTIRILYFPNVKRGRRVTVTNSDASEVQVTYANYEEVASTGQRATVALYDIYGNPVSTGYLDNLGMCTLSTKGKPGIYIVKVTMNNQVIFNQRIQAK